MQNSGQTRTYTRREREFRFRSCYTFLASSICPACELVESNFEKRNYSGVIMKIVELPVAAKSFRRSGDT